MANEIEDIFSWYPLLVLVSRKPVTWHGFLKINSNTQIGIKMKVPNYPELKDVSIIFNSNIHLMYGTDFPSKLTSLKNSATSVLSFLNQLQKMMDNILMEKPVNYYNSDVNKFHINCLEELKDTLTIPGITVFVDKDLNVIKMTHRDISIQLKQDSTNNNAWMVLSSDLPQLKAWDSIDKNVSTLSQAANTLKKRVDVLENTWQNLKTIDENCWVIDPPNPQPHHLYRRIHLNSSLSLLITLDPLDPESLQEIKILGCDSEVLKCQNTVNANLEKWSYERTMIENLLDLLDVSELPKRPNSDGCKSSMNDGIVSDEECCICFSTESDNDAIPSEICNNKKCQRVFHTSCLSQWLAAVAGNQTAFNCIHGTCPNCNEHISCRIVSNQ